MSGGMNGARRGRNQRDRGRQEAEWGKRCISMALVCTRILLLFPLPSLFLSLAPCQHNGYQKSKEPQSGSGGLPQGMEMEVPLWKSRQLPLAVCVFICHAFIGGEGLVRIGLQIQQQYRFFPQKKRGKKTHNFVVMDIYSSKRIQRAHLELPQEQMLLMCIYCKRYKLKHTAFGNGNKMFWIY